MSSTDSTDVWEVLRKLPLGQPVEIADDRGKVWKGTIVPHHELSEDRLIQLKLESGYNIGLRILPNFKVRLISSSEQPHQEPGNSSVTIRTPSASEAWIGLLTTGGTIASRVDYQTGGVKPVSDEGEILEFYPGLDQEGPVRVIPVLDRLSEDIAPSDWLLLARKVSETFASGACGVVITHGTDTLAFTSASLAFLLQSLPGPVVLVGAQRSPDRPSSDGFSNLHAAVHLARTPQLGEVVVLMHSSPSDTRFTVHRGTRVRKMHSSRRDAFRTLGGPPLGWVEGRTVSLSPDTRRPSGHPPTVADRVEEQVGLLWFHPGLNPVKASAYTSDLRGLVLAGTGLGHVGSAHFEWISEAITRGTVVVMTTQCLDGLVDPYVYATGRELLRRGVLYVRDLLPETAFAKLSWACGVSREPSEVRRLMLEDRAGEFQLCRRIDGT